MDDVPAFPYADHHSQHCGVRWSRLVLLITVLLMSTGVLAQDSPVSYVRADQLRGEYNIYKLSVFHASEIVL